MTLVKWNNRSDMRHSSLDSVFDTFFNRNFDSIDGGLALGTTVPAVNIIEEENSFNVEVAAPGLHKDQFRMNLDNNILTISAENKDEKEYKGKVTRREFSYSTFERSFTLPDSVDGDKIKADYKEGVLKITLPKKEEAKRKEPKQILIN